ncbi:uncharacterized protein LOC113506253 [Trichoplusia ni]|uniref:Uncharacterized protein LOC113506253 n=1 Tax=Trichoplusia ni TaxID=7111 RepID=A0A7E5WXK8_TRINI|nr:uncharacterized protein LOC113506253 [Trichoplusia ni]
MKTVSTNNVEHDRIHSSLIQRETQERIAIAGLTTEILSKLNISIESLPQKCQQLLHQAAETQQALDIEELDPIVISLHQTKELSENLEDEYEILKLKQRNMKLKRK